MFSSGRVVAVACAIFLLLGRPASTAPSSSPPNILMLHVDSMDGRQMAWDSPSPMPNLRRLQERGTTFSQTYTNSPECVPSRAAIWSGRQIHHTGAWNNGQGLAFGYKTMMDYVNDNPTTPYNTTMIGRVDYGIGTHSVTANLTAWLRSVPDMQLAAEVRPFAEVWDNQTERVHDGDWVWSDQCVDYLGNYSANAWEKPFFITCGFATPHPPFVTSDRYWDMVNASKVDVPEWLPLEEMHPAQIYSIITKNCSGNWTDEELIAIRRTYYGMVAEADAFLGQILDKLDESNLSNNTHVIFWSDHGEEAMDHQQFYKMVFYEGSARVPLVFAGPGVMQNHTVDRLTQLLDIYPTVLELTNSPGPDYPLDGYSLVPDLVGNSSASTHPGYVWSQFHSDHIETGAFMLREGDMKYIAYVGLPPQLFNVTADPDELTDLSTTTPQLVQSLDLQLQQLTVYGAGPGNYTTIDAMAKSFDHQRFSEWRKMQGANYTNAIEEKGVRWHRDFESNETLYLNLIAWWAQHPNNTNITNAHP